MSTDTPTPITDAAHQQSKIQNQGIPDKRWPWDAINAGWDFARNLERVAGQLAKALERHDSADGPGNFQWHKNAHLAIAAYEKLKG